MKLLSKKGQVIGNLQGFIMAIVSMGVVIAIGLYLLQEMQYATTSDGTSAGEATAASNATGVMITKMAVAPTWVGLLIIVVFATAILAYFYMR